MYFPCINQSQTKLESSVSQISGCTPSSDLAEVEQMRRAWNRQLNKQAPRRGRSSRWPDQGACNFWIVSKTRGFKRGRDPNEVCLGKCYGSQSKTGERRCPLPQLP
jgi:hypothetical protein